MKKILALALLTGFGLHAASIEQSKSAAVASSSNAGLEEDNSIQGILTRTALLANRLAEPNRASTYGNERLKAIANLLEEFSNKVITQKALDKDKDLDDQTRIGKYLDAIKNLEEALTPNDLSGLKSLAKIFFKVYKSRYGAVTSTHDTNKIASSANALDTQLEHATTIKQVLKILKPILHDIKANFANLSPSDKEDLSTNLPTIIEEWALPKYAAFKNRLGLPERLKLLAHEIEISSQHFTEADREAVEILDEYLGLLIGFKDLEQFKIIKEEFEKLQTFVQQHNVDKKSLVETFKALRDEIAGGVIATTENKEIKDWLTNKLNPKWFENKTPNQQLIYFLHDIGDAFKFAGARDEKINKFLSNLVNLIQTIVEKKIQQAQ